MRTRLFLLFACGLTTGAVLGPARPARATGEPVRVMRIESSKVGVPLGEARLSVEPLVHAAGKEGLSANYKVEITPFTFKSEAGRFSVAISNADLQRLTEGATIHFTGQAVSQGGDNTSTVEGRATPADGEGGALRIQVEGKKGKLVFHTIYHLTR